MREPVHGDARSAWDYLCEHGGIELKGRDEGLDQRIRQRLNPAAGSLEEALAGVSMEAFARAFFEAIHPFVAIFRDILDFFEHADATEGQAQWTIRVGDVDLRLEHFRKSLATWTDIAKVKEYLPSIDERGMSGILNALGARDKVGTELQRAFRGANLKLPHDVQEWIDAYNRGEYTPLPGSLTKARCPKELRTSASIVRMAIQRVRESGLTRDGLVELWRRSGHPRSDPSDALDFWGIAGKESDYLLRSFVIALSAAGTLLSHSEMIELGNDLAAITDRYPLRPFGVNVSIRDIESVLSLPVWKKRYELYSVWIATEIVRALKGHRMELHHTGGRIAFAFRETLVATVQSSPGPFTLVSERRSPLQNPRGEGRRVGVQPDHALWTEENGTPICRMAIEVKHYKASARRKFVDVFEDYARAFPRGAVYLVNYGPVGNAVDEVSDSVSERCHAIGFLTPSALEARQELAKAVRDCVGEPIKPWPSSAKGVKVSTVLVLDVSGSMKSSLCTPAMDTLVRKIVETERPGRLVAVNSGIVGSWPPTNAGFAALLGVVGGSTGLEVPIHTLLQSARRVVIVTDHEGFRSLQGLEVSLHKLQTLAPSSTLVRVCTKTMSSPKQ